MGPSATPGSSLSGLPSVSAPAFSAVATVRALRLELHVLLAFVSNQRNRLRQMRTPLQSFEADPFAPAPHSSSLGGAVSDDLETSFYIPSSLGPTANLSGDGRLTSYHHPEVLVLPVARAGDPVRGSAVTGPSARFLYADLNLAPSPPSPLRCGCCSGLRDCEGGRCGGGRGELSGGGVGGVFCGGGGCDGGGEHLDVVVLGGGTDGVLDGGIVFDGFRGFMGGGGGVDVDVAGDVGIGVSDGGGDCVGRGGGGVFGGGAINFGGGGGGGIGVYCSSGGGCSAQFVGGGASALWKAGLGLWDRSLRTPRHGTTWSSASARAPPTAPSTVLVHGLRGWVCLPITSSPVRHPSGDFHRLVADTGGSCGTCYLVVEASG